MNPARVERLETFRLTWVCNEKGCPSELSVTLIASDAKMERRKRKPPTMSGWVDGCCPNHVGKQGQRKGRKK